MNYRILSLFVWASLVMPLCAQETKVPSLPVGPLLKRAPDYSTWSMIAQGDLMGSETPAKEGGAEAHEKPVIVAQSTVVKTGTTILEQNVDVQGQRREIWHVKGLRVTKPSDGLTPIICPDYGGGDIQSINFTASDFAGLDWISAKTYTGIKKYQGRDCIIFNDTVSPLTVRDQIDERALIAQEKALGMHAPDEKKVPAVAYIDLETRLPLLVTFGSEKRVYQYGASPTSPLVLPPELTGSVKAYAQKMQRLSAPAARAF